MERKELDVSERVEAMTERRRSREGERKEYERSMEGRSQE